MQNLIKIFFFLFFSFLIIFQLSNNSTSEYFEYPTEYTDISSSYGYRDIFDSTSFHNGIDFLAPQDSKVFACASGIVVNLGFSNSFGNYIVIKHSNNYYSLYGHLSETFIMNIGDYVNAKEHIANVGPKYLSNGILNGLTTGPHLHFTIYNEDGNTINPKDLLENK